jgi:hypothetical protein
MATAPPKGGGNILTRKIGPLPGWAWAGVAVGGYYLWKKRQAAAAAAAAPATTSTAASTPAYGLPSSSASAPSGYGYQGPGVGNGGSGPIPTGATAATSAPTAGVAAAPSGPAYSQVSTPQEGAALQASGVPIYVGGFQGLPNQYVPFQSGVQYPTGTSEYVQNQ